MVWAMYIVEQFYQDARSAPAWIVVWEYPTLKSADCRAGLEAKNGRPTRIRRFTIGDVATYQGLFGGVT